jgi:hypothetical protein
MTVPSPTVTVEEAGVFVLGMHRSGTSAVTRLVSLLGLRTPPEEDLVQPTDKNPKGYWESESLVAFTERVLNAVGCDMRCPIVLEHGWENDVRLDSLRREARGVVDEVFSTTPWVWKDPRHCLAFGFWRSVLPVRPVVILVNRNPLEIAASAGRVRTEFAKPYTLALWERYLRQALGQIEGLSVLVTSFDDVLSAPLNWCHRTHAFLSAADVLVHSPRESDVLAFVDAQLRHTEFARADVFTDPEVSDAQRMLHEALEQLEGAHDRFSPPSLPAETPATEALLGERRRTLQEARELARRSENERQPGWWRRVRPARFQERARSV